ncbi:Zn-finger [Streptococcus pneumoniae]|nr:Zn-finger [Streptococcus pneumoniae]
MSKHPHYELLNLIGYGLAKFDKLFIKEFQCSSKSEFYRYVVSLGIAETTGVVKNRMDLFDLILTIIEKVGGRKLKFIVFVKI